MISENKKTSDAPLFLRVPLSVHWAKTLPIDSVKITSKEVIDFFIIQIYGYNLILGFIIRLIHLKFLHSETYWIQIMPIFFQSGMFYYV
jgi:hypothetical protein